jgi:hypothetical protein
MAEIEKTTQHDIDADQTPNNADSIGPDQALEEMQIINKV